ncbi:MAG: hypothetical protein WDM78_21195 [Puia sp.]
MDGPAVHGHNSYGRNDITTFNGSSQGIQHRKETLVDFLVGKGFSKDDLKPTAKLTDEMYRSLQQEFQGRQSS